MKRCPTCQLTKPFSEFHKDKRRRDGVQGYCKPCKIKQVKDYGDNNPARRMVWHRKHVYGITDEQYNAMLDDQLECCAICGNDVELHVDHKHSSGKVRGLLCSPCNVGLGMFKDSTSALKNAIEYLERSSE